jgi:aspartate beta-hydroxylase
MSSEAEQAVRRAELALQASPGDVAVHHQLATAHRDLLVRPDAEAALARLCADLPFAFTSLLHLARLQEQRGDSRGALLRYLRAIKTAQLRGFWHDERSTPPWLVVGVQHAMKTARAGRLAFFHEWMEAAVQRHGKDEMRRVSDCLAMYLGVKPTVLADPRQKPTFLYFPGLPVTPVFERDALAFADALEAETAAIREEMQAVVDAGDVQAFHYDRTEAQQAALTAGGAWDAYFFYADGERVDAHHDACPRTSAALARLPLDHVRDHGPEVCFSVLRPGAHILPHRGVTNTRSVLHLGLRVPPGCALRLVGVGEVGWEEGRCFAFDDTYEHEAWNRSDQTRVVLLGDIWNPHLRAPECEALAGMIALIGDFNRSTAPTS